jgi:hypothetical protein
MGRPRKYTIDTEPGPPGYLEPADLYAIALGLAELAVTRPGWRPACELAAEHFGGTVLAAYCEFRRISERQRP